MRSTSTSVSILTRIERMIMPIKQGIARTILSVDD